MNNEAPKFDPLTDGSPVSKFARDLDGIPRDAIGEPLPADKPQGSWKAPEDGGRLGEPQETTERALGASTLQGAKATMTEADRAAMAAVVGNTNLQPTTTTPETTEPPRTSTTTTTIPPTSETTTTIPPTSETTTTLPPATTTTPEDFKKDYGSSNPFDD